MKKPQQNSSFRSIACAIALVACFGISSCKPGNASTDVSTAQDSNPAWLTQLIGELKLEEPANPPAKIYRYTYGGQQVYLLSNRCCDVPSKLYDANGNVMCEPDGGITGKGDGRCPDFFEQRQNETLVWEDKRKS